MAVHGDRPPASGDGGSPAPAGAANVLEVRTVPSTAGFNHGDVINVAGELLVLVDDDTDANVLRGVGAAGSDDYRGVNAVSGGANNYGSWADPAYQGEVSWYTVGGGGSPSWRIRLPDGPLGGSPPATIYAQVVAADGQTTDVEADRDAARDSTSLTAYASGDDDPRAEIPVGMDFTVRLWTGSWNGAALDVHDVERWEKYHLVAGPDVPPTREQGFHLVEDVLEAGDNVTLTPNAATSKVRIAATGGGQGQQSPGTAGFSRGPTAPASPAEGHVWSDTTSDTVRRWTGTAWEDLATEGYVDGIGFSRGPTAPASPAEGHVWSDTASDTVRRWTGTAWEDLATEGYVDGGDAVNTAALDALATSLVRRATWARAWIRAASQAAALAGTSAATWTNQGAGTPPTGAHWSPADVPAGAGNLYELVALVSPAGGSATAWTFGTWTALEVTATNTQYSVDGSSSWHAVRADADRYERHFANGAWGPAIALYDGGLDWAVLLSADIYHATVHWLPGILLDLPAAINFTHFGELRFGLQTVVGGGTVLYSSLTVDPGIFISVPWADRADTSPDAHTIWQMRLNGGGLAVVHGNVAFGTNGPWANGLDAGLSLVWVRPNAVSSAVEAAHLRCIYLRNRGVTHRLRIEGR